MPQLIASNIAQFTSSSQTQANRKLENLILDLSEQELLQLTSLVYKRLNFTKPDTKLNQTQEKAQNAEYLTIRENEVLTLVARGYTRPEVAAALNISPNTAATHISSIYRKLDVSSIAEATMYAVRRGLIS